MRVRPLPTILALALFVAMGIWWTLDAQSERPAPAGIADSSANASGDPLAYGGAEQQRVPANPAGTTTAASTPAEPAPAKPATGTLRAVVRGPDGAPVANCTLAASGHQATTDATGTATLELDVGRLQIRIAPPSGRHLQPRSGWQTIRVGVITELVVALVEQQQETMWCQLVAAENEQPVANCEVRLQPTGTSLRTDANGSVQLAFGPEDTHADAKCTGRSLRRIVPTAGHSTPTNALRVPLAAGSALRITTADSTNTPVSKCVVTLTANPWDLHWPTLGKASGAPTIWVGESDPRGELSFTDLPTGVRIEVRCVAPPHCATPPPTSWVLAAASETRRIELPATGELRGRVRDADGKPMAGVTVQAVPSDGGSARILPATKDHHDAETDTDGRFRIAGLSPGPWLIGPAASGPFAALCTHVDLPPAGVVDVELRAERTLELSGHARTVDGQPAVGIQVNAIFGDDFVGGSTTDRDGHFAIQGLPPGTCDLLTDPFENELGLAEPVSATAGATDVELRLAAIHGTLSGRVAGGGDVWVTAMGPGFELLSRRCDLDGSFCYRGLRLGTWSLAAHDETGRVALVGPLQVLPARETAGITFDLAPAALLQPKHSGADEFRVLRGDLEAARDSLQPGTAGEARVLAGSWTVVFRHLGREVTRREVSVRSGETLVVDGER